MSIWFVPRDAAARSMGADAAAKALGARGETVIRNGSRGHNRKSTNFATAAAATTEKRQQQKMDQWRRSATRSLAHKSSSREWGRRAAGNNKGSEGKFEGKCHVASAPPQVWGQHFGLY